MALHAKLQKILADEFPNVVVVRWSDASEDQPDYFVSDGVHLTTVGQRVFIAQIMGTGHLARDQERILVVHDAQQHVRRLERHMRLGERELRPGAAQLEAEREAAELLARTAQHASGRGLVLVPGGQRRLRARRRVEPETGPGERQHHDQPQR